MTSSRSKASRSSWGLAVAVVVALVAWLGAPGAARAEKKRVVVLEIEGPKGERFHAELIKLVKQAHTVVSTDKWNGTAAELDASTVSATDIQAVARKLKVDAVVEGRVESRKGRYVLRLRVHEGKTGGMSGGPISVKSDSPRFAGTARRELVAELLGAIDAVPANQGREDDDPEAVADEPAKRGFGRRGDDKVAKKAKRDEDDAARKRANGEDEDAASRKRAKAEDDEADPATRRRTKVAEDEDTGTRKRSQDEDTGARKRTKVAEDEDIGTRKRGKADDDGARNRNASEDEAAGEPEASEDEARPAKKRVASREEPTDAEVDEAAPLDRGLALSPGQRAVDVVVGLSLTMRRATFNTTAELTSKPPGYKGSPVAGAMFDATLYPFALGHDRTGVLKNIGLNVMYDRVLSISSKSANGMEFATSQSRFAIGATARYPFSRATDATVALASLAYSKQSFTITDSITADFPSVQYSLIAPGLGLRVPLTPTVIAGLDAKVMLVRSAGEIENADQYGAGSGFGFEGAASLDYLVSRSIFVRAAFRVETIGLSFEGKGTLAVARDNNAATVDVGGAQDTYVGGFATVGFLY